MTQPRLEDLWRREAPHVLAALIRRYGGFERCEDASQEALLAAFEQWPQQGQPDNPRGWLIRVASRRLIDDLRGDRARADRELWVGVRNPADAFHSAPADSGPDLGDDSVQMLLMCCHPALTPTSQICLTLRAVAGLTTEQIAAAFLVPTTTMAQRISRAKATFRTTNGHDTAATGQLFDRLTAAARVLYLTFNEGYTRSDGVDVVDVSLTGEAIRLTRRLRAAAPDQPELAGLLALMLLIDSRTAARTDRRGDLIPLADQDRRRWDRTMITEGIAIVEDVLPRGPVGPFQLEAAIAAVHAESATWEQTDWRQITVLYRMLDTLTDNPVVTLNLGVAVGMSEGPEEGLAVIAPVTDLPSLQRGHRVHAVRAHLLESAGRLDEALDEYVSAARLTSSTPEQRYLNGKIKRLRDPDAGSDDPAACPAGTGLRRFAGSCEDGKGGGHLGRSELESVDHDPGQQRFGEVRRSGRCPRRPSSGYGRDHRAGRDQAGDHRHGN